MASESTRQRQLLDSGFLDNIGSNEPPVQLDEVERVFVKWMSKLVEALQDNLNTKKNGKEISASGNLSETIRFQYTRNGFAFTGEIYMADYADFVDKGVRGVGPNNKNTTSPYSFKSVFPSKNMQKALLLWVRQKSVLSDATAPKGLLGRHTKTYLRNKMRATDLAIRLGVSIKRHGTAATNFKQVSVDQIMKDMMAELSQALAKDIVIDINLASLR